MKNIKISNNLTGDENWPRVSFVDVPGNVAAEPLPDDGAFEQIEGVIQSWSSVAVLKVEMGVLFKFGFIQGDVFKYLKEDIQTDSEGRFGVRINNEDIRFFVLPKSMDREISLELVEIVSETDRNYNELPLY